MRFEASIEIDVDAGTAWRVLTDYARDAEWRREVVSMVPSEVPVRAGTTTEEVARLLGTTFTTPGRVTAVEPGRRLAWEASSDAVDAAGERIVEPLGASRCRVRLPYDLRAKGATRAMMPILGPLFRRSAQANLRSLAALLANEPVHAA